PLQLTQEEILQQPLPPTLPPEMFTGPGLLALSDLLPVMTAYIDADGYFRFVNKSYAEWMLVPHKEILARHLRDVLLEADYLARRPLMESALAGERQFFAAM